MNTPSDKWDRDQNVYPIVQDDVPRCSRKYLREICCYRIEYSAINFLATFIGRRPSNSAALANPTHRD